MAEAQNREESTSNQSKIRVLLAGLQVIRVAKTCRPFELVGANFFWLVLIFGQNTQKNNASISILLVVLALIIPITRVADMIGGRRLI